MFLLAYTCSAGSVRPRESSIILPICHSRKAAGLSLQGTEAAAAMLQSIAVAGNVAFPRRDLSTRSCKMRVGSGRACRVAWQPLEKIDKARPKLGLIDFLSRDQERQGYYTEFLLSAHLPGSISSLFSCCASLFR